MTKARSLASLGSVSDQGLMFRNRIINGDFKIDQRSSGASTSGNDGSYGTDRWVAIATQNAKFNMQQNLNSITPPPGFTTYLGVSSSSALSVGSTDYMSIRQWVEGCNTADLGFGTSTPATVTISFWVRSSIAGLYGGNVINWNATRVFPFSYTINSANTWEQKSVTLIADTTGTWYTDSRRGVGISFNFANGSGMQGTTGAWSSSAIYGPTGGVNLLATNGATFYITGVQFEKGSIQTPYEFRPYAVEANLCYRYCYQITGIGGYTLIGPCQAIDGSQSFSTLCLPASLRASPSIVTDGGTVFANESADFTPSFGPVWNGHNIVHLHFQQKGAPPTYGALRGGRSGGIYFLRFSSEL